MAAKSFYCISGNFHCSNDLVDHQKLKIIQKEHFMFWCEIHGWGYAEMAQAMNITPKHEMLVFGLCLTSDDQLSNPSYKSCQNCKNNGCQIILLHFWQLSLLR